MKQHKLLPLAAASLVLGLGVCGTAQAGSYALAYQNVTNGVITFDDPNVIGIPLSTTSNSVANLNGTGDQDQDSVNAQPVWVGASGARVDNVFNIIGVTGSPYASADAAILQEQQNVGDQVGDFFQAANIAEYSIEGNGSADASGRNSSTTGFVVSFEITGGPVLMTISFDNDPYMRTTLTPDSVIGQSSATAELKAVATIVDGSGTVVFDWAPDGQTGGISGNGTELEIDDETSINRNLQSGFPGQDFIYDPTGDTSVGVLNGGVGGGACAAAPTGGNTNSVAGLCNYTASVVLGEGQYTFNLGMQEVVFGENAVVPEPGMLTLMGLGLFGFGMARRRRQS